jgi:transcriptional regulator with XRE-family HTH domain
MDSTSTCIFEGMNTGRPPKRERTAFGQRLAEAREQAGLTQQELAERVKVDQRVITYWERRPVALRPEQLKALADALGVSTDYLLGRPIKQSAPKGPVGTMRRLFEAASGLPRNQQQKLVAVLDAFVKQNTTRNGKRE